MTSHRRLADGGVAVLLHLGDPSGRCQVIEVIARGASLTEVMERLRASGLEGVRRPERGSRPYDSELEGLADPAVPFLWREWPDGAQWLPPGALLS